MSITSDEPINIPLAKRLLDILVSAFLLSLFFPLIVLIVVAIKIEGLFLHTHRGPILYSEKRLSQGKPFTLRKFRIFKRSAYEPIRARGEIVHTKPLERNPQNITACGKLLKAFYLDELPQLWNVLIGDMSLVGPRPWNPVDYNNEIRRGEFRKKIIKAGLTGMVQLHKQNTHTHGGEHKMDWDYIAFVKNKNGLLVVAHDIKILAQSLWFMLKGQGL